MQPAVSTTKPSLVAIGYSTGGLSSLLHFFDRTPCDNASYIILNHVPRDRISYLRQILSNHSPLEVIEVHQQTSIENNKIYIMPPPMWLGVEDSHLYPVQRPVVRPSINHAIDVFLQSFSLETKYEKFAVFFSGNGNDGVLGAELLKKAGGKILVQDPATCEAPELPANIIMALDVDVVTTPEKMPALIQSYIKEDQHL